MSAVVLDASATVSQSPAVYAETLFTGGGGLIASTDPTTGVRISRNYGALGATPELLMAVRKDLSLPPSTDPIAGGVAGGTVDCAGITFQGSIIAQSLNAGNSVMGIAQFTAGVAIVNTTAVAYVSPANRSIIMATRSTGLGPFVGLGPIDVGFNTGNQFTATSLDATTGLANASDNGYFAWIIFNPNWSS
jgi:hypothetical protein